MSYNNNLKKNMDEYTDLLNSYHEIVESPKYAEIQRTMPFDFVMALNICNLLKFFNDDNGSRMIFESAQDASAIYNRIVEFRNSYEELLENADYVAEAQSYADQVNKIVDENIYLPSNLKIQADNFLNTLAKECIREVPEYKNMLTKKFRTRFTESCIESLPQEELDKLVMNRVIRSQNLDMISPTGTEEYEKKLSHLCGVLNHPEIVIASYKQTLKGTSFENEDGKSRQEILKSIAEAANAGEKIALEAEQYMYKPEIGQEELAIRVMYKGQDIGYISKDVVKDIFEKYPMPKFKAELKEITGGDKVLYGCNIDLHIYSIAPHKDETIGKDSEITQPSK